MHALLFVALLTPRLVAELPGAQAVSAADGLVILAPDLLHLTGTDRDGKRRWRRRHQATARGIQALFVHEGRVLFYAGEQASLIDPRTGAPGPAVPVPWLSTPSQPGCWLNLVRGAYAFYCPCRFQFARPDGAPLGAPYRFHEVCMHEPGGGGSCGCWGSGGDLVGRAGDLALARIEEPPADVERGKKRETYGELLVAVSTKTGQEAWRQPVSIHRPATYIDGLGVMPDGLLFWTADAAGRISVHDATTGALRWRDPPADDGAERPHQPESRVAAVAPDGLFFFANQIATLYDARTGAIRWRHPVAPARLALAADGLPTDAPISLAGPGALRLLRTTDGAPAATLPIETSGAWLLAQPAGRVLVLDGPGLRLHAPDGRVLARATVPSPATLAAADGLVTIASGEATAFFDATTLAPRGVIPGDYSVVEAGGDRAVLSDRKANQIRIFKLP